MKMQFLALSLLLTAGLYADCQTDNGMNDSPEMTACESCQSTPCNCEPCCIPKLKKCIDCECYNPSFYDLQCNCGFFIDAEFLYWYARETNLPYALEFEGEAKNPGSATSDVVFSPGKTINLTTKWSPGVRGGVGWNSSCDGWDFYFSWTYLPNRKSNITTVDQNYSLTSTQIFLPNVGQKALLSRWINPAVFPATSSEDVAMVTFDTAKARWKLNLNIADLELGRKYWTSPCFNIRPYLALRGVWDEVKFRTILMRTDPTAGSTASLTFQDSFKNRYWGVGFLGGLQPAWSLCQNLIIYGNVDAAMVVGWSKVQKSEDYQDLQQLTSATINWHPVTSVNKFLEIIPILDLALGVRWEETWCCEQYYSALDIGWEHHVWFDTNHRSMLVNYFFGPGVSASQRRGFGYRTFDEATGNLDFGGLVVRLRLDF